MTDTEVVKALECCAVHPMVCKECPYMGIECCTNAHRKDALDLIKRQKIEIESLKIANEKMYVANKAQEAEIDGLEVSLRAMRNVANGFKSAYERESGSRITAIQDFAERLKEKAVDNYWESLVSMSVDRDEIDDLVKEMIGKANESVQQEDC